MKIKVALLTGLAALSLGAVSSTNAQAKTLKYRTTSSNSFSYTTYHQAFMRNGEDEDFMSLYTTADGAENDDSETFVDNFEDFDQNRVYYARKVSGYSDVMQFKYRSKSYYVNLNDAHLYRYNAWRSGHKIVSTVSPNSKYAMLKAHTHVYSSQPWYYNYGDQLNPSYSTYKLSKKGHWYEYF
ncbi:hypothetical protein HC026_09860 [Lactobacillus sp. LC28-10]|uniref:Surface layer protein A domain-containing protein n=1 Tax=Secundilactobacillus angelensis TaxID=2722706 RepID=A0ABX1L109_9LACO|nr:hypothetical protein [Secundilactobacillus angelensis]MCH5463311.1 hypothetical protein [Secundilactobacillus angelensis]NLR19205.1 hypothetical protein [Secundilactobacillus angelensis]